MTLYVAGRVACNLRLPTDHASLPIRLKVAPKRTATTRHHPLVDVRAP